MPWLRLGDPVAIGLVTFFDYPADVPPAILNDDDRARLDRLKSLYRNWPAEDEIATLVIAAVDLAAPLRPVTAEERAIVRRAGHALAATSPAHDHTPRHSVP